MSHLWIRAWDRTLSTLILKTHFIVRISFCTTLCVLSIDRQVEREREREMHVLFEFHHFFLTQRTRLRISKIRVYLCKKNGSTMSLSIE